MLIIDWKPLKEKDISKKKSLKEIQRIPQKIVLIMRFDSTPPLPNSYQHKKKGPHTSLLRNYTAVT